MPLDHAPPAAWPDPVRPVLGDSLSAVVHETKLLPQSPVGVTEAGTFEGYASLFGVPDLAKDVVSPGAFADSQPQGGD